MKSIMRITGDLGAVLFGLIALLTFCDVIGRYIFSKTIPGGYDLGQQLQAIVIFWGMAVATYDRAHITVDMVWETLSPKGRWSVDKASDLICAVAFGALFLCTAMQIPKMMRSSEIIPSLGVPLWIFTCVAVAGVMLATLGALLAASHAQEIEPSSDEGVV
jgi:TRAP-type transport system small permease protein